MKAQVLIIVLLLLCPALNAQTGFLTVVTEPYDADAYLDTVFLGRTPLERVEVSEGRHLIRVVAPSSRDWNAISREETVVVSAGEELRKTFELGSAFSVHSKPYGAGVFLNGAELGETPLYYRSPRSVRGEIILRKEGFEPKVIDGSMPQGTVLLTPTGSGPGSNGEIEFQPAGDSEFRRWAIYSSAAAMIVSGVFSAHYKHRANSRFDTYLSTNDPAAFSSTERNDRRSAIALVVTQISFGLLTYLLLSE